MRNILRCGNIEISPQEPYVADSAWIVDRRVNSAGVTERRLRNESATPRVMSVTLPCNVSSYVTMAFPMGNLAALRTFRVLRALKTVAVVPGELDISHALITEILLLTVKQNQETSHPECTPCALVLCACVCRSL